MSKPRSPAQSPALAAGLIVFGSIWAVAAPLQLQPERGPQQQAIVAPVHYQGGSHCHSNCALGKKCLITVCHCKVGNRWTAVQGTSCQRRASIHQLNVTGPKCTGGAC